MLTRQFFLRRCSIDDLTLLFDLEAKLEAAINAAKVGEFDGNEVATDGSDGTLNSSVAQSDR